jgi:hypothetical protein
MQNIDCIVAHPVKNPEWIANDGNDADLRALREARSSFRQAANALDDMFQPAPDGFRYRAGLALAA